MVKALPETTPQNGPPSRKVKVNVVANSFANQTAEAVTTSNKYPSRVAPVIELEHKPNGRA